MNKQWAKVLGVTVLALGLCGIGGFGIAKGAFSATPPTTVPAFATPTNSQLPPGLTNTPVYPPGTTAIQPHAGASPAQAAFTADDVRNYFATHGLARLPAVGGTTEVTSVMFIPARQASALANVVSVGRPDDALVCYVTLHGTFRIVAPGATISSNSSVGRYTDVKAVFDAHTGNLLMYGTL